MKVEKKSQYHKLIALHLGVSQGPKSRSQPWNRILLSIHPVVVSKRKQVMKPQRPWAAECRWVCESSSLLLGLVAGLAWDGAARSVGGPGVLSVTLEGGLADVGGLADGVGAGWVAGSDELVTVTGSAEAEGLGEASETRAEPVALSLPAGGARGIVLTLQRLGDAGVGWLEDRVGAGWVALADELVAVRSGAEALVLVEGAGGPRAALSDHAVPASGARSVILTSGDLGDLAVCGGGDSGLAARVLAGSDEFLGAGSA